MARKRIIFVGGGGIGERHVRCFLTTGDVEASVCDTEAAVLDELSERYQIAETFAAFEEVPLDEYDAAVIAVPAHLHVQMALRCADAGLPFLLEKPLSTSMDGVDELVAAVEEQDLYATVGFVRRSDTSVQELRRLALGGVCGELKMGRFHSGQEYPRYRPDYRDIYYARPETGGGCIMDAFTHSLNLAQWIFGDVVQVVALYDRLALTGVEVEDSSLIAARFSHNDALVHFFTNQFQKPNVFEVELIGTEANLRYFWDPDDFVLTRCDSDENEWVELARTRTTRDRPFIQQAQDVLAGIDGRAAPVTTIAEAAENLRVLLAAKRSMQEGRIISIAEDA
ncbi:MAG: Gfo/Idh/MocA family protein [Armatimonadota bacterium]